MSKIRHYKKVYLNSFKNKRVVSLVKTIASYALLGFLSIILFSLLLFAYYAKDLPRPENFTERAYIEPTRIYDRTGEVVLYTLYGEEKRDLVDLEEIPDHLIQAVIAAEDSSFYTHLGVDLKGITRAFFENIRRGRTTQGGSTISQQLIRSSLLSGERTLERKVRETILTLELERRYSKDEIMEFYLNQIPLGSNAYGVEAASQAYFNKPVSQIDLTESAILASLIRSPSYLSPYGPNIDNLMIRKDYVIDRMATLGYISEEEAQEYKEIEISFHPTSQALKAPHFTMEVIRILNEKYDVEYLRTRGLKVYTTLDWDLQAKAEEVIKEAAVSNRAYHSFNASLVAINPNNGHILSMVGSADYFKDPYPDNCIPGKSCLFEPYPNVAMRSRQPGSAFKPFVYADAFNKGHSDKTIVEDEPINIAGYSPRNYDGLFRGPVTMREALAQSLNVPSVKVLAYYSSVADSINLAQNLGITTLTRDPSFYGLPLVLGGGDVTLLDMTSAYGVFATEGERTPPSFIIKITDSQGRVIDETNKESKRVLNSSVARTINSVLSDNEARSPMFGANSSLNLAGTSVKTGTTQNYKDGWTVGYTPSISVGVWAGNNDNTPMVGGESMTVAAPAWRRFMEYALSLY